jgi:hypothetical protein
LKTGAALMQQYLHQVRRVMGILLPDTEKTTTPTLYRLRYVPRFSLQARF